jgi:gamma-glutamylcyclotransferase (GGCT)/AIG2-like uncharacterized protein YtfP
MKIFVYGTLKRGGCRAHHLKGQTFLGMARTAPRYRMYNTGSYPALVDDAAGLEVEGELWDVDEACMKLLDEVEWVPTIYRRDPVCLVEPPISDAQTYIYQKSVAGLTDCGSCWKTEWEGYG